MTVLLITIPLMVLVVAIATVPVLMAMISEHKRHQGRNGHLGQPLPVHSAWSQAGAGLSPSGSRRREQSTRRAA